MLSLSDKGLCIEFGSEDLGEHQGVDFSTQVPVSFLKSGLQSGPQPMAFLALSDMLKEFTGPAHEVCHGGLCADREDPRAFIHRGPSTKKQAGGFL